MHVMGLCLPVDFRPVFAAGAAAGELGTGQQTATPWDGNSSKRRGNQCPPSCFHSGPMAGNSKCWHVVSVYLSCMAPPEWQDLISKIVVTINLPS